MMDIAINDPHFEEKSRALNALYGVMDPELYVNIVDLGLIYGLEFEDKQIKVAMTFSTPHCPLGESIVHSVIYVLEENFPGYSADVEVVWEPAWSFEMVSEEGKSQLGI